MLAMLVRKLVARVGGDGSEYKRVSWQVAFSWLRIGRCVRQLQPQLSRSILGGRQVPE